MSHPTAHSTNFWFGFTVGTLSMATVAFLLGTKKGRELLKKAIAYAENYEYTSDDFLKLLDMLVKMAKKEFGTEQGALVSAASTSVENLMSKMKDASNDKKHKKFFTKS